jgi:hypothetical protein
VTRTQVLIRVARRPREARGERLALYLTTRTATDPSIVVYSFRTDQFRVEEHRALMDRTRRANPTEMSEAIEALALIGEDVQVLQSAPRVEEPVAPAVEDERDNDNPDYPEYYLTDDDDHRGHS